MFEVVGANLRGVTLRQKGETDAASDLFVPWECYSINPSAADEVFDEQGAPLRARGRAVRMSLLHANVNLAGADRIQEQCIRQLFQEGTLHVVIDRRKRLRSEITSSGILAAILVSTFAGVVWMAMISLPRFSDAFDLLYVVYGLVVLTFTGVLAAGGVGCLADLISKTTPVRLEVNGRRMRIEERGGHFRDIDLADTPSQRSGALPRGWIGQRTRSMVDDAMDSRERAIWKVCEQREERIEASAQHRPVPRWKELLRWQAGAVLISFLFWMQVIEYALGREQDVQQGIFGAAGAGVVHCCIFVIVFMVGSESRADARRKHLGARFEQPIKDPPNEPLGEAAS